MTATAEIDQSEDLVLRQDADAVATLTLNRPAQLNALSHAMLAALQQALDALAADRSIRAVILQGAGRAFCAGHDLKEMRANPDRDFQERLFADCSRMMLSLRDLPQPVIAKVHGIATAAGCQLVAGCDLAVASTDAQFAASGINVGLFCTNPGVALGRTMTRKHAMEMLLTGDMITAEWAQTIGLVNRLAAPDKLDEATMALVERITEKSPFSIALGKQAFYRQLDMSLDDAYAYAGGEMARNMMAADAGEGIDAFIAKRKPEWRGE